MSWPALMDEATSSAYCSLERQAFRRVASRLHVGPVDIGLRVLRWRRSDLDKMIEQLPVRDEAPQPEPAGPTIEQTMAAVANRRQRH